MPGPVRRRRRAQARAGAAGGARARTRRWPTRTSTWSRSPRSPTSCRCWARTAALVRAGLRALAATRKPGLRALMEVARVDPSGVDASAIGFRLGPRHQRRRPPAPRRRRARAAADRGPRRAPARSPPSSTRSTPSAATSRRGSASRPRRRSPSSGPARPRYVLAGRGLAPGRDRDRRLADRRAPPPPGGADRARRRRGHRLGPLDPGASTCSAACTPRARAPAALRRPPRRRGPDDRRASSVDAFREAFAAHAAAVLTPEDLVPERAGRRGRARATR